MSAQNLLHTIPAELEIDLKSIDIDQNYMDDYKAFIVLAIFKSMCMKINTQETSDFIISNTSHSRFFKGWLYKLYMSQNTSFVSYRISSDANGDNKILHIFSHGGISNTLMSNKYDHLFQFCKSIEKSNLMNKIKDIILSNTGVSPSLTQDIIQNKNEHIVPVDKNNDIKETNTTKLSSIESLSSPVSSHVYDPPCKIKSTQQFLSRDNIFLAAFYPTSINNNDPNSDNCSESAIVNKTNDLHVATSILVDSCDTQYDRLYDRL
jgi:hypothetical protein